MHKKKDQEYPFPTEQMAKECWWKLEVLPTDTEYWIFFGTNHTFW